MLAIDRDGRTVLDTGELLAVINQIDAATGTVKAKAVFPNKSNRVSETSSSTPNLSSTARRCPHGAAKRVQRGAPGTFVYVGDAREDGQSACKVQLGVVSGDRVVITSGLKDGKANRHRRC